MRHAAIALLAAILPVTAAAQDMDARVTDVVETSDGYKCRAQDLPELSLSHSWRGADRSATWEGRAREGGTGDPRLRVAFTPQVDRPSVPVASIPGFQFDMRSAPLRAQPRAALLRLDGIPNPTRLDVEGSADWFSVIVGERQREELAARLMSVSIVEVDLADAFGTPLGRYSFDIRRLRRAEQVLQIINWSCR